MIRLTTVCWLVVVILCSTATVFGQLLLQETFNTPTTDISTAGWTTVVANPPNGFGSTNAPPYIVVNSSSALSYQGYIESGSGNSAYLGGAGQDAQVTTGAVNATVNGVVYLAFMMKVDSASTTGDYVWVVRNTSNHNRWRMWIKSTSSTTYELAVSRTSTNPATYTSKNLAYGTTYLVISKYDFKTATTTDATVSLWVNPSLSSFGTSEDPSPAISNFNDGGTDFATINRFALVMQGVGTAPYWYIGGIRMASTWADVLPSPPLYYNGTGDITDPSSWGSNLDGTGTHPTDFGTNGQLYFVRNAASVTLTAPWVVGGTGSKVIVGNGVNFTFGSGGILTAPIDVASGGTITLATSDWPIFGSVAGSVNIGAGITLVQDQLLPASTGYYVMSGDLNVGTFKLTVKGRLRTSGYKVTGGGTFQLDSAGTLGIYSAAGITTSGATGDIQTTTRTFSPYGTYAYMGSVDQVTGNALPDSVSNFTLQMGSRTNVVTLTKALRVLSNLTMTLGKAKLGNINLWFSNPVGGTDSSYIITDGTGALVRPITNTGVKTMCIGSATDFRRTVLTFESTPTATNISFRFIAGDPGSAGYPVGIVKHDVAGSWMLTYDVNPLSTYKLDITLPALADVMRLMSRANPSTAWAAEGTLSTYTTGVLSTPGIATFGQEFAVGGSATLAVGDETDGSLPKSVSLKQNYPNPFNPATTIVYELPREERVSIAVYNIVGQQVATVVDGVRAPGVHRVTFDASRLSSGVYLYQLRAGSIVKTQKMLLMK